MVNFRVRLGVPADLPVVAEIFRAASLSNEGDVAALRAHPDALMFGGNSLADGYTRVATTYDDQIVGFATLLPAGDVLELEDIFVAPEWMRHGIGRLLIHEVLTISHDQKVGRIEVTANPHAFAFYESVGFVHDGQVETAFGLGARMHLAVPPD